MLEQRLIETEAALFDVTEQLRTTRAQWGISAPASRSRLAAIDIFRSNKASKTMKMAEWKRFPLETAQDIDKWCHGISNDRGLSSIKSGGAWATPSLNDPNSTRTLSPETVSNTSAMEESEGSYDQLMQSNPHGLEIFDGMLEHAFGSSHAQGGQTVFQDDGHNFSLGTERSMHREYSQLDAEEDAAYSMPGTASSAPSTHEQRSPMSTTSPLHHGADPPDIHDGDANLRAHSLSKKMAHIYY